MSLLSYLKVQWIQFSRNLCTHLFSYYPYFRTIEGPGWDAFSEATPSKLLSQLEEQ